jgi:hypothetical protein
MRFLFGVQIIADLPELTGFFLFLSWRIGKWATGVFHGSGYNRIFERFWSFRDRRCLLFVVLLDLLLLMQMQMRRSYGRRVGIFKVL